MACAFPEEDLNEICDPCGGQRTCVCLKCVVNLCDKCKDSHVDNVDNHDILDLPQLELDMPMCEEHDDAASNSYCWICQASICDECVKKHESDGHAVIDIVSAAIVKRNHLVRQHAEEKHRIQPQLENQVQNIEEGVEAYKAYIQNLRDAMVAQAERMKEMVNEIVEERQRELKQMEKNSTILLEEQRQKLEGHMGEINDTINEYREIERSGDQEKIKEFADKNLDKIKRLKQLPELVEVKPPTYESPQVDVEFIRKMFGTLEMNTFTWTTSENLVLPDTEDLIQLPELNKEEFKQKFGTLIVTEAEATEDQAPEQSTTPNDEASSPTRERPEVAVEELRSLAIDEDSTDGEESMGVEEKKTSDTESDH